MIEAHDGTPLSPAPDDVLDRLDEQKITAGLRAHFDDDLLAAMHAGRLRWALKAFDSAGLTDVVVLDETGAIVAGATVHWSVIVE